ncbi:hypothetical protein O181_024122 [Austropuccinia psidii MF-1]|uniref:Uncharacterized protein n=1 Tax=Austropuccinia psidii MF-1 TaxID=1389203 RepID=A0A9Q3GYN4_9BASI|nr:hypothetical protein [Austropuccinia psidii MF-1]
MLCRKFVIFKKLGVKAYELDGLLAQAAWHAPSTLDQVALDQLLMVVILAKGNKKPFMTFVGQVILSTLQKNRKSTQHPSPFIYLVYDLPKPEAFYSCPPSSSFPKPVANGQCTPIP